MNENHLWYELAQRFAPTEAIERVEQAIQETRRIEGEILALRANKRDILEEASLQISQYI